MAVGTHGSKAQFAKRLADVGYEDFLVLDRDQAATILTERRTELLDAIREGSPESITGLAELLDRDVAAVHRDLDVLFEHSLVDYEAERGRKAPRLKHAHVFVEPIVSRPGRDDPATDSKFIQEDGTDPDVSEQLQGGTHRRAAEAFARRVRETHADAVASVRLYGSVARGETRGTRSDVDLFVTVHDDADVEATEETLRDLAYDVELDYGVALSLVVKTETEFETERDRPFLREIRANAELLYG